MSPAVYRSPAMETLPGEWATEKQKVESYMDIASAAVHRKFGHSKRFSERDKRQIAALIASNSQVAMESWKNQVEELRKQLQEANDTILKVNTFVDTINGKLGTFLKRYHTTISEVVLDTRSTTQALLEMSWSEKSTSDGPKEVLTVLEYRINALLQKLSRLLLERDTFSKDREFCRRLLESSDKNRPLSDILHQKLEIMKREKEMMDSSVMNIKFKLVATEEKVRLKQKDLLLAQAALNQTTAKTDIASEDRKSTTPQPRKPNKKAVSTRGKSFQGSIKYRQHRFENKPGGSAAVAKVLPIRPKVALSPVPRIKKEKTFLL